MCCFTARCIAADLAKDGTASIDLELVELAALCHDVGDRKYYQGKETGGQLIETFLSDLGYAKAKIVANIVDHVGFSKELGWDDEKDNAAEVEWRNTCLELHAYVVVMTIMLSYLSYVALFSGSKMQIS